MLSFFLPTRDPLVCIFSLVHPHVYIYYHKNPVKLSGVSSVKHEMFFLALLSLLLATTISAEIVCRDGMSPGSKIPSAASCDVALSNLARFMFPYLAQETVKVGQSRTNDIQLPQIFTDDTPGLPPSTLRCMIDFLWDTRGGVQPAPVPPNAYDVFPPGTMQTVAKRIRDQCIAGSPPRFGKAEITPHNWVLVIIESVYFDPGSGVWSTILANGTEGAADASMTNPVAASRSSAAPVPGLVNDLNSHFVESS